LFNYNPFQLNSDTILEKVIHFSPLTSEGNYATKDSNLAQPPSEPREEVLRRMKRDDQTPKKLGESDISIHTEDKITTE
jgi:hypothetical protein